MTDYETPLTPGTEGCLASLPIDNGLGLTQECILSIEDLSVRYKAFGRETYALNCVSLKVNRSEIVAIVGESGSGKSTLALSLLKLLPTPGAEYLGGRILFENSDIVQLDESQMAMLRGTKIAMIFQEPMSSLDPVYRIGDQMREAIQVRDSHSRVEDSTNPAGRIYPKPDQIRTRSSTSAMQRAEIIETLKSVQIPDPELVMRKYPHELSGGMAQRVIIAQALIERPALLIADEPTSALDVTTQAQVLNLMRNLRTQIRTSIVLITHDLAVAAQLADRVIVMYAGEIFEDANTKEIFRSTLHPYTEGLIHSYPDRYKDTDQLDSISGDTPDMKNPPTGCRFHPRCRYAFDRCKVEHPNLLNVKPNHSVSCFLR